MKKLASLLTIISILFSARVYSYARGFTDITEEHYAYSAAVYLKEKGILSGYEDGSFAPDRNVTRAEMAAIVCRVAKLDTSSAATSTFTDIAKDSWALSYVCHAADAKIINGDGNGTFRPDDNVTYEEAIKMTLGATGLGKLIMNNPNDWSKPYLDIAESAGITQNLRGTKGVSSTRADIALMVYNALQLNPNGTVTAFAGRTINSNYQLVAGVNFVLNTDIFFGSNTSYHRELNKASAVLSMLSYPYITTTDSNKFTAGSLMKKLGFTDVVSYELKKDYSDSHITQIFTGHKTISKDGIKAELVPIIIRGTNGSFEEWSSNFEIGSGDGTKDENKTKENHEGYDITANRIIKYMESYEAEKLPLNLPRIYWIAGHSRGGSVANICAVYLSQKGNKCFAYTFGSSNSTTSQIKAKYDFIFNTVNEDDLVTYIPLIEWGFGLYGRSSKSSVFKTYLNEWSSVTGLKEYNHFNGSIVSLTAQLASCAPSRKACYEYTDDGKLVYEFDSQEDANKAISSIKNTFAPSSLDYCKFEVKKAPLGSKHPYVLEVHMQPAFLMQNTAAVISGRINPLIFTFLELPSYLQGTKTAFIQSYLTGGLVHPHTPETYYVLAECLGEADFNK